MKPKTKAMAINPDTEHGSESIPSMTVEPSSTQQQQQQQQQDAIEIFRKMQQQQQQCSCGQESGGRCKTTGTSTCTKCNHTPRSKSKPRTASKGTGTETRCCFHNQNDGMKTERATTTTYAFDTLGKCDTNTIPLTLGSRRSCETSASTSTRSSLASIDDRFSIARLCNTMHSNTQRALMTFSILLVLLQASILGLWINLYHLLSTSMAHTFSWLFLLNPMGSIYQFEKCDQGGENVINSKCDVTHSTPFIAVVGIWLTSFGLFNSALFFVSNCCRKAVLIYLKQAVFLQCLFLIYAGTSCGVLLNNNLSKLRETMEQEMGGSVLDSGGGGGGRFNESLRWRITQTTNECCGMNGFFDWSVSVGLKMGHGRGHRIENKDELIIPMSCYSNNAKQVKEQKKKENPGLIISAMIKQGQKQQKLFNSGIENFIFQRGCYEVEYNNVLFYGKYQVILLIAGLIISIGIYLAAKPLGDLTVEEKPSKKEKFENVTSNRIFIRQGSNFTAFGGQGKNSHVIRRNNILMEATGALASSTGVNENMISLEILNYSEKVDKVHVSRESDRIVITVTKHGIIRGRAIITAKDDSDLEKIVVSPMAFGITILV